MGIAGAGNSGTALAALFAPRLATHFGWQHVYGFAAAMMLLPLVTMIFFAKEPPDTEHLSLKEHLSCLFEKDGWPRLRRAMELQGFPGFDKPPTQVEQRWDLVENALTLTLSGSNVALRADRFELGPLVDEAVADSALAAKDKDIHVEVEPHQPIEIHADRRLISSAVTNVVGNAVKFSHRGGTVRVMCKVVESSTLIEVEDQCGGLPAGAADKMFTAFVQVGKDRTGYGLGLAIARQAVEAHGGSIHVKNREGDGCTITIELPKKTDRSSNITSYNITS